MISPTRNHFRGARARQPAQGLAEYSLILAGVALAAIVAVFALGPHLISFYTSVQNSIPGS